MKRDSLDLYDNLPEDMEEYLMHNGRHFSRKLCAYAVSLMRTGADKKKLKPFTKEEVDNLLKDYNIEIENKILYDHVFVANMGKSDYLGGSIPDNRHLCLYIKEVLDDVDGYDGIAFNRWYADMCRKGIPIDWYEMR